MNHLWVQLTWPPLPISKLAMVMVLMLVSFVSTQLRWWAHRLLLRLGHIRAANVAITIPIVISWRLLLAFRQGFPLPAFSE